MPEFAVVRNIQNNDPYAFYGGTRYKNLRTGVEGDIPDETARKIFKVNLELTTMLNENEVVADLIHKLNLKIDKSC